MHEGAFDVVIEICAVYDLHTNFQFVGAQIRRVSEQAISQAFPEAAIRTIDVTIADIQAG